MEFWIWTFLIGLARSGGIPLVCPCPSASYSLAALIYGLVHNLAFPGVVFRLSMTFVRRRKFILFAFFGERESSANLRIK